LEIDMAADDLLQWLRTQFNEDAARAGQWHDLECTIHEHLGSGLLAAVAASQMLDDVPGAVCDCGGPARMLREVNAKRALLRAVFHYEAKIDGEWGCCHDASQIEAGECEEIPPDSIEAVRLLALPYVGKPGYREEWRPNASLAN
jgi:hypothetical protein